MVNMERTPPVAETPNPIEKTVEVLLSRLSHSDIVITKWYQQLLPFVLKESDVDDETSKTVVLVLAVVENFIVNSQRIAKEFHLEHIFNTIQIFINEFGIAKNPAHLDLIKQCVKLSECKKLQLEHMYQLIAQLACTEEMQTSGKIHLIIYAFEEESKLKPFLKTELAIEAAKKIFQAKDMFSATVQLALEKKKLRLALETHKEEKGEEWTDETNILNFMRNNDSSEESQDFFALVEYITMLKIHRTHKSTQLPFFMSLLKSLRKTKLCHECIDFVQKISEGYVNPNIPKVVKTLTKDEKNVYSCVCLVLNVAVLSNQSGDSKDAVLQRIIRHIKSIGRCEEDTVLLENNSIMRETMESTGAINYIITNLLENGFDLNSLPLSKSGLIALLKLYEVIHVRGCYQEEMTRVTDYLFTLHQDFEKEYSKNQIIKGMYTAIGALAKQDKFLVDVVAALLLTICLENIKPEVEERIVNHDLHMELMAISNFNVGAALSDLLSDSSICHETKSSGSLSYEEKSTEGIVKLDSIKAYRHRRESEEEDNSDINFFEGQKIEKDLIEVQKDIANLCEHRIFKLKKDIETLQKIKAKETIEILHNIYLANDKIQQIIHTVLLKPRVVPKNALNETMQLLYKMYSILRMVRRAWLAKKLSGIFTDELTILNDQIKFNMNKVIDILEDNHQSQVIDELKQLEVKLKLRNDVEDYEIPKRSGADVARDRIGESGTRSRNSSSAFMGRIQTAVFKDETSTISVNENLGSRWLPDGKKKKNAKLLTGGPSSTHKVYKLSTDKITSTKVLHIKEGSIDHWMAPKIGKKDVKISSRSEDILLGESERRMYELTKDQVKRLPMEAGKNWISKMREVKQTYDIAAYHSPEALPEAPEESLRYHLLARLTREYQSLCIRIMTKIERTDPKGFVAKRPEPAIPQTYKFLFLVDNSGSMNGEKMTTALNILVIFLEAMKRLEFETAVVRYGGEKSQAALKGFNDNMDEHRGQLIIEGFSASEKTRTADALKFVAEKEELFKPQKKVNEHRFIILISDGIWDQKDQSLYNGSIEAASARLLVLTTHPREDLSLRREHQISIDFATRLLNSIAPDSWCGVSSKTTMRDKINEIALMIDNQLRAALKEVKGHSRRVETVGITKMVVSKRDFDGPLKYNRHAEVHWGDAIVYSDVTSTQDYNDKEIDDFMIDNYKEVLERKIEEWDSMIDQTTKISTIEDKIKAIDDEEECFKDYIGELDSVLDTVAFPNNRPTRFQQDYRGSKFSLNGYIKFLCTRGQHKKIYENMIGSPRKDYIVAVILDTSMSMSGMGAIGCTQSLLSLASSLSSNNITFTVLTCGKTTTIVKDLKEDYDQSVKAKMYDALQFNDNESNISDAIFFTSLYLDSWASTKVEKSIFILTDGYPTSPKSLRKSLLLASELGIHTTALGVGFFTDGIFEFFPNHVVVNNPKDLPAALKGYFGMEPSPNERQSSILLEMADSIKKDGVKINMENVWDMYLPDVYRKKLEKLDKALSFAIAPGKNEFGSFKVDLCFVLDTTGSMSGMIKMAQEKIVGITQSIEVCIKKSSDRDAKVRVGFVGYKIKGQDGNLDHVQFTDDTKKVLDVVRRQKATGGSSGGVEDKYEPLEMVVNWKWTGLVKFLVLIADAPGHGLWCTGTKNGLSDDFPERENDMPGIISKIAEAKIYLFYVNIREYTDHERKNFKQQYIKSAPEEMKEKGFQELKIDSTDDGDKLAKLITGTVEEIIINECM
ncbi:uncharacterized protein [Clytia hemisphaerica]|uniref:VWFA domain-containing protein n=1 Tax=Clytia hemisphaerica TaxID=252671 RepID=A0A7M5VDA5_9CNID